MLALVRMEELKNRKTSEISGGQQQRVALARALAPQPKVLLLDEPLSALDLKLRKEMQVELKRLQTETGITFVFVTHDQEEALTMSDRIAVMRGGKIHQVGSPRDIYHHPENRFVASFIGDSNFLRASLTNVSGTKGEVALEAGGSFAVESLRSAQSSGAVTALVRPEHASLSGKATAKSGLSGTIDNIVYFGTDTHFHLTLGSGEPFTLRQQNSATGAQQYSVGDQVALSIDKDAVQVLRD